MRKKRFLAVVLTASMVVGSSVSAFASETEVTKAPAKGSMKGSAQVEGYLDKDIFKVEVPTVSVNGSMFNFVMDPQGLIEATSGNRYKSGKGADNVGVSANDFEYGTLYFANVSGNNTKLSPTSDAATIRNKSTFSVNATLTTAINKFGNLKISSNLTTATEPSIQLSLSGNLSTNGTATADAPVALSDNGVAEVVKTISGCDGDYSVSFNTSSNKYEYVLSSNSANFAEYSFQLTGASGGGDYTSWSAIEKATKTAQPEVVVTWDIVPYVTPVAPSITGSSTFAKPATGPIEIPLSLGAGTSAATSITKIETSGGDRVSAANYEYANGILKLKGSFTSAVSAMTTYTITFDNNATVNFTITV